MENPTPTDAPVKKKKFKKLIVLLLALVFIGGAAGGGFYYWRSMRASAAESKTDSAKSKKKNSKKSSEVEAESASPDNETPVEMGATEPEADFLKDSLPDDENVKHIVELQPFIVNLADSEQARYLRMTVNLGIGGDLGALLQRLHELLCPDGLLLAEPVAGVGSTHGPARVELEGTIGPWFPWVGVDGAALLREVGGGDRFRLVERWTDEGRTFVALRRSSRP